MFSHPSLPRAGVVYVTAVVAIGAAVVFVSLYQLSAHTLNPNFRPWYLLAALALLSGSVTVKLPSVPATISISETFVFTSVIMFGPWAGVVIVALDGLVMSIWLSKRRREPHRVAFNMAGPALSMWLASQTYYLFPWVTPIRLPAPGMTMPPPGPDLIYAILVPLAAFALTHFIINSWLITFAISIETRKPAFEVWWNDFLWLSLNYFGAASVAAFTLSIGLGVTYFGVIIPLLLILYFTFKIPMARVEDTMKHLDEVNSLYISTVETLALAVDAKDQVTHGHIRRVQTYAVGLARQLGISDPGLLKAIEASALLHDMGKLAIPEHILNKPGRLTAAEFDKIKMHAGLGADLLSAIAFPYPVIPIVRHHHENWDGTGYPTGITGTQIPIGARILSVVDCYDALTSERPYRPRLPDEDATAILIKRRGSMYDPLVVDTFIRVHRSIGPPEAITGPRRDTYADITRLSAPTSKDGATEHDTAPNPASKAISQLVALSLAQDSIQAAHDRAEVLMHIALSSTCAGAGLLVRYDEANDNLEIINSEGFGEAAYIGKRISLGERLTGWVGANAEPMVNADAALDLFALAPDTSFAWTKCLSMPLLTSAKQFVGVLSIYSADQFTSDDVAVVGGLTSAIAEAIMAAPPVPACDRPKPQLSTDNLR